MLIAQAVFVSQRGRTDTRSHRRHCSPYPRIGYGNNSGTRINVVRVCDNTVSGWERARARANALLPLIALDSEVNSEHDLSRCSRTVEHQPLSPSDVRRRPTSALTYLLTFFTHRVSTTVVIFDGIQHDLREALMIS